ncbi:MAG TPA: PEP/pyruvate-binding domain-containing protein [Polyangia bacterium]|nr:PEP/pyruvate-binding domain-containing protein [Polyangia bacterium]
MLRRALLFLALAACGSGPGTPGPTHLRINELVPDNDGTLVDEEGQADDWLELYNPGPEAVELSSFTLTTGGAPPQPLPAEKIEAGKAVVLWADNDRSQGSHHLGFKLAAKGGHLVLRGPDNAVVDEVSYPEMATNEAFARLPDGSGPFAHCRYTTPMRTNGAQCGPPPPPDLPPEVTFRPFAWPEPTLPGPLVITEVALYPARFVEVANAGEAVVSLVGAHLRLAAQAPGAPWPGNGAGVELPWPQPSIAPGERLIIALDPAALAPALAELGPEREGVLSLYGVGPEAIDRVAFSRLPDGAALSRTGDRGAVPGPVWQLCAATTPGLPNDRCESLPRREVGDRVRQLLTDGDFAALAEGGTEVDSQSVKFIVDLGAGGAVHFLGSKAWALHYTFIRERIDHQPALNRCDPGEAALFEAGWREFSDREYFKVDGRRYLMGTLVKYGGSGARTLEFARGDVISGPQMRTAFFAVMAHLSDPHSWSVRPQAPDQVQAAREVEGSLPLLDPNAPFRGLTYQPLTPGVGYGVLRFVRAAELATAPLGPDVIVVTDDVPNDIPLVGGVVTEAFQTPLSHVSILSRNRGIPNMALTGARKDARLAPLLEKLVRLEVTGGGFTVAEATPAEAQAFWDKRRPQGPPVAPRLDPTVRGVVDLRGKGLDDLPSIGAKASQLAELGRLVSVDMECPGAFPIPPDAFAVPVIHSIEHFQQSGAAAVLQKWRADPAFLVDPRVRAQGLAEVRAAIIAHPVAPDLLAAVEQAALARFGHHRFRLRSSSNTEDLPSFSGAGLYTSISAAVADPDRTIADGLRTVWSSLWNLRAFDERSLALIDSNQAAMAVLVHQAYDGVERANGVCVSRDILDPTRSDISYINAQLGEASVTNPAPGITSEQLRYEPWQKPPITYQSHSSLTALPVMRLPEVQRLACYLRTAHTHFREKLDPQSQNRWFAIEFEWKLVGPDRQLVIKQGRPYGFGTAVVPPDCREF